MDFYNLREGDQDVILEMVDVFHPLCSDDKPYMNYEIFYMWDFRLDEECGEGLMYGGHEYKINEIRNEFLSEICYFGKLSKLKCLIEQKNADFSFVDYLGNNLLFSAACCSNPDVVSYLLELGLNPNHQNDEGEIPLKYSILNNTYDSAKALIKAGANPRIENNLGENSFDEVETQKMRDILLKYNPPQEQ